MGYDLRLRLTGPDLFARGAPVWGAEHPPAFRPPGLSFRRGGPAGQPQGRSPAGQKQALELDQLAIFSTCEHTIRTVPTLEPDQTIRMTSTPRARITASTCSKAGLMRRTSTPPRRNHFPGDPEAPALMFCPTVATASTGPIDGPHRTHASQLSVDRHRPVSALSVTTGNRRPRWSRPGSSESSGRRAALGRSTSACATTGASCVASTRQPGSAQPGLQRTARTSSSPPSAWCSPGLRQEPGDVGRADQQSPDLRLLCDTVSTVTQTMLEDAKLKQKAKRTVRAA